MREKLDNELKSKGKDMTYNDAVKRLDSAIEERDSALSMSKTHQRNAEIYKGLYFNMVEGADLYNFEKRRLIDEIKKYNPLFDYLEFMKVVDKDYEQRYGKKS